jgi:hypothetical protein
MVKNISRFPSGLQRGWPCLTAVFTSVMVSMLEFDTWMIRILVLDPDWLQKAMEAESGLHAGLVEL